MSYDCYFNIYKGYSKYQMFQMITRLLSIVEKSFNYFYIGLFCILIRNDQCLNVCCYPYYFTLQAVSGIGVAFRFLGQSFCFCSLRFVSRA